MIDRYLIGRHILGNDLAAEAVSLGLCLTSGKS
jgi:hypothetical protein